jgi:hypothetical protein
MGFSAEEDPRTKASIVFEGTVTGVRTNTSDAFPHAKECITVQVTKFRRLPESLRTTLDPKGKQELTVKVTDPAHYHKGDQAVFYTRVWILRETAALSEVAPSQRLDASTPPPRPPRSPALEALAKRLAAAELVVQGQVLEVNPVPRPERPVSEKDPHWADADIRVETVLKGKLPGKDQKVIVRFPQSKDVLWKDYPRFEKGQQGIWLLHKQEKRPHYVAPDTADFQPTERLEAIRSLLAP